MDSQRVIKGAYWRIEKHSRVD
nr:unnamed protein product [Callosobruchus analis]